ncbi:CueP family metal-binding protein [Aeromicrobium sp. HA]|uniref:CueP family metal-binding protein n=1 Tax=Aeromicrobium sp. HA TaxID=3009077 RepID=UPI0022AF69A7|nr:CueP family metal-binding protein [Aeromicrobium sp. HA]
MTARRRGVLVLLVACLLAIAACSGGGDEKAAGAEEAFLARYDLDGLSATEVIDRLDAMPVQERPEGLTASVRPDVVVLGDGRREVELPMPRDEVYVSVAPYRRDTHDCHFHSLTTCLGELANAPLRVELTAADGEVVLSETRSTFDNGFVGLWVPRGIRGTLTVEHEGSRGTVPMSTRGDQDATCVTTLRLT